MRPTCIVTSSPFGKLGSSHPIEESHACSPPPPKAQLGHYPLPEPFNVKQEQNDHCYCLQPRCVIFFPYLAVDVAVPCLSRITPWKCFVCNDQQRNRMPPPPSHGRTVNERAPGTP
ncbi:8761_t:CDS:2 [Acaulospora morrowiae]|uniref:8761_t:CDS:1 n=1 Tax=Acaulospora morrowiae TaxID=94023 RepID=A0A9N8Z533_9GLOM|nr:8761_t:CDS:2 [Acaulospora morrowiae]